MNRPFVIADLHFGHLKVAQSRGFGTVEAHDDALVAAWNSVVTTKDVVYVLGDVFRLERMPELRGLKKLVMGNHDKYPAARYAPHFTRISAYHEWEDCLLSHMPVHPNQIGRYRLNVHGHMHEHVVHRHVSAHNGQDGDDVPDKRYRCVSVEQLNGMRPRLLDEVIA